MTNFTYHHGHPPTSGARCARPTLVRVWRSLHADGRAPLVSQWIAIPSGHLREPDVCALHLCSLELRSSAPREPAAEREFDDPGPALAHAATIKRG